MGSFRRVFFECDPHKIFISQISKCDFVHVISRQHNPSCLSQDEATHSHSNITSQIESNGDRVTLEPIINATPESGVAEETTPNPITSTILATIEIATLAPLDGEVIAVPIPPPVAIPEANYIKPIPPPSPLESNQLQPIPPDANSQNQPASDQPINRCMIMIGDCQYRMMCIPAIWQAHKSILRVCLRAFYRCSKKNAKDLNLCLDGTTYSPQERYCVYGKIFRGIICLYL